ncbi:hypothetical protein EDC63_11615 [Sulfurirhabdus autotrophica]|uniref:Uncharacterized protein n=1 Tax=Sulfurirhabdus autotrophica TaxID=1706046 RepID=A0A4R3XUA6_9PROT|nr:hypothetical protein EDC63_11615 [Sulfurirhabdus autotrophica]
MLFILQPLYARLTKISLIQINSVMQRHLGQFKHFSFLNIKNIDLNQENGMRLSCLVAIL